MKTKRGDMTKNNLLRWKIDTGHSEVHFRVKHLGISYVTGLFKLFKGEVVSENDHFDGADVQCVIDVNSLDTNNERRDKDLKSEGFFDVQKFPEITFIGQLKKNADKYLLEGTLTIREIANPVVMNVDFTGIGKGRFGDTRAGFEIAGKIYRKNFGLSWNILSEAGGLVIGEEIKLHFEIQLIRQ